MSTFTYQGEYNTGTGLFASGSGNSSAGNPIGTIIMFGAPTPPTDYLLCDGTAYSTGGAYAQLFAVIGTSFDLTPPAGQFRVPNMTGKFPAGSGGSSDLVDDRQMETLGIGTDGSTATNTNTGKSILSVEATPDHHHASGTLANSDTIAVNDDATLSTAGLSHNHWYGHVHFNRHTHDEGTLAVTGGSHDHAVGTIAYNQSPHTHPYPHTHGLSYHTHNNIHDHDLANHTHDLGDHVHDLDAPGYTGNWAFPFGYNRFATTSNGYWYGTGNDAAANGASACYYPRSIAEQNNTTNPAGSVPSTNTSGGASSTTTTGPNLNITDAQSTTTTSSTTAGCSMAGTTATGGAVSGTIAGDTGNQKGTEYADPLVTGSSRGESAPHNSDVYTNNSGSGTTIPDHTHLQQDHSHSLTGNVGAYKTTADAAITQQKYAPPFLSLTFCIRYRQT